MGISSGCGVEVKYPTMLVKESIARLLMARATQVAEESVDYGRYDPSYIRLAIIKVRMVITSR